MDITKLIRSAMMSRVLRGYEFAVHVSGGRIVSNKLQPGKGRES